LTTDEAIVPGGAALRAYEPLRIAGTDQGIPTGVLSAAVLKKLSKAEFLLELNIIIGHVEPRVSPRLHDGSGGWTHFYLLTLSIIKA
jgi:hypothetical protein